MEEAMTAAMVQSAEGDVVLLSPACARMDIFQNFMQRGHRFAGAVDELAMDRGEVA